MNLQLFAEGEKTHAPSPRRRQEARNRGQVFHSPEVTTALAILAGTGILWAMGASVLDRLAAFAVAVLGNLNHFPLQPVWPLYEGVLSLLAAVLLPIMLGMFLLGTGVTLLQTGLVFRSPSLDLTRLNPLTGLQRIFSRRALVYLAEGLFKVAAVSLVAYSAVAGQLAALPTLMFTDPVAGASRVAGLALAVGLRAGVALLILGIFDYFYQRYDFEQNLRMTDQEVKEEFKDTEGSPHLKKKLRTEQRRLALRRMMSQVPRADVVITNPVHYAVALVYHPGEMDAPRVVAKGQGFVARRIAQLATEHRVPVVRNEPLAQALYRTVEVGDLVPAELFQAVAEVLAFVYRLRRWA